MGDDMFKGPARVEPSADMLTLAKTAREMYTALRMQGFGDGSACRIIGTMLGAAMSGSSGDKDG